MKRILLSLACLLSFEIHALDSEPQHEISIEIKIKCPMSEEFQEFVKSIPPQDDGLCDFAEWKSSFINNMTQLIHLVESEKICNSQWSVSADAQLPSSR